MSVLSLAIKITSLHVVLDLLLIIKEFRCVCACMCEVSYEYEAQLEPDCI